VTAIAAVVSFGLGIYFSVRTIAALYRVIDLWYALRRERLRVVTGILGWGGGAVVALLVMHRSAFLWGFTSDALLFVVSSLASRIWFSVHLRD